MQKTQDLPDAIKLPGLLKAGTEIMLTLLKGPTVMERHEFEDGSSPEFKAFWGEFYKRVGNDPEMEVVLEIASPTPMRDPETGVPFRRVSLAHLSNGVLNRFSAEEVKSLIAGSEEHSCVLTQDTFF